MPSVTTTGAEGTTGDDDPTTGVTLPTTTTPNDDSSGDDPDTTAGDDSTTGGEDTTAGEDSTDGTTTGDTCGDGVLDDGEDCDGKDFGGEDCATQGFAGGTLACAEDCTFDTAECTDTVCGDDIIEGDEQCEGKDLAGADCVSEGFDGGTLACGADCNFDPTGCFMMTCGNDTIEGKEACDGADLAGQDCVSQGFDEGTLACDASCTVFDTSGCSTCGDDTVGGTETCDGADLNGQDCVSQGFDEGTLACNADCGGYDTSGCATCGDDTIGGTETCDGADLGGQTCESQGFAGGVLACNADCGGFDTSGCVAAVCGNDTIEGTETCDGADLGGQTCETQGFDGGTLGCAADCSGFDTSACTVDLCGNGVVDPGEACDGADVGGADCVSEGFLGGNVGCSADCLTLDTYGCYDAQTTLCSTPGTPIGPDAGTVTVDTIAAVGNGSTLVDVDVFVDAAHTWSGDMEIDITHVDSGTTVRTFDNDCGNVDDMLVTFDDSALAAPECISPVGNGGTGTSLEPLAGFAGLGDGTADWQISITDTVGGDGGALNEWCITLNTNSTAPVCGDGAIEDPEVCEGFNGIAENRCEDFGFAGGPLSCASSCLGYDTSGCSDDLVVVCSTPGTLITNGSPFVDTIDVPAGTVVGDIDVFVDIDHTWAADLDISLTNDGTGTNTVITNDVCGSTDNVYAVYNDDGIAAPDCSGAVAIEGNVTPVGDLTLFEGAPADGTWSLNVNDLFGGDDGILNEWCVYITPAAP